MKRLDSKDDRVIVYLKEVRKKTHSYDNFSVSFTFYVKSVISMILFNILQVQKDIPVNLQIELKQILPVKNLKPAVIKVYDYYQTSKILCAIFSVTIM